MAFPAGAGVYSPASAGQPERLAAQAMVLGNYVTEPNQPLPRPRSQTLADLRYPIPGHDTRTANGDRWRQPPRNVPHLRRPHSR